MPLSGIVANGMALNTLMPDLPSTFGRKRPVERTGGSAILRDHSARYRALRSQILAQMPLCAYCYDDGLIVPATVVDHLVALALGGDNGADNLIPSCHDCNGSKGKDETNYLRRSYDIEAVRFDPLLSQWFEKARSGMVRYKV